MNLLHLRQYDNLATVGRLFLGGDNLGATLEDIGRPDGIKIQNETCIPEGLYAVTITKSTRFGRDRLLLFTDPADKSCRLGNIRFTGIRVHKGTKTAHTAGCVLFAGDLDALEAMVQAAIDRGEEVTWEIRRDDPPVKGAP